MSARITNNNFAKAKRQVEAAMESAERKAAEAGVGIVKSNTPVDLVTPDNVHLVETIRMERSVKYHSIVAGDVAGGKVNYAGYVEFGTEKTGAQPYMSPSVPFISRSYEAIATEELRRALT